MKEFNLAVIEGGVQIHAIVVAKYKKDAAKIFGCSISRLNDYCSIYEPKEEIAINSPNEKFAYFDSGWMREKKPHWYRKVMPYDHLANYIRKENKKRYDKMLKDIS